MSEHAELAESESNDAGVSNDPEVEELVLKGNMEQLASLVLNGEGRRLVGRQSDDPELQAFIDNVPAYMVCILLIADSCSVASIITFKVQVPNRIISAPLGTNVIGYKYFLRCFNRMFRVGIYELLDFGGNLCIYV